MKLAGQSVAFASKHGKAEVLWEPLRRVGLTLVHARAIDTDAFGTFDGRVPRPDGALEAARRKVRAACAATGLHLGLASEGSFTSGIFGATVDHELLLLADLQRGFEWVVLETDEAPHVFEGKISTVDQLHAVLEAAPGVGWWCDGASLSADALEARFAADGFAPFTLVSDLRAHRNPRRLATIARAADRLVSALQHNCPTCECPGFGLNRVAGAPGRCTACGAATTQPAEVKAVCIACGHADIVWRADDAGDPSRCPECNP